jgi:hypothetical protein
MVQRGGAVHVVTTRRQYKGRVYTTYLLRRSYRDGDKVKRDARQRVRAHIFLCMLAYYVEWNMREAWPELLC